jgi:hypothetical protein
VEETAQPVIASFDELYIYMVLRQGLASCGGVMSGGTSFVSATRSDDVECRKPCLALLIGYAAMMRCTMSGR